MERCIERATLGVKRRSMPRKGTAVKGPCIWCMRQGQPTSVEHVIPDALGCPDAYVLRNGEVCRSCNNGLAPLDRAVAQEFDVLAVWARVPRKRGRDPVVDSRGNVVASIVDGKPNIHIRGRMRGLGDGRRAAAGTMRGRNVRAELEYDGGAEATIKLNWRFGEDPRFVRGICKIALSGVALYNYEGALEPRFNEIRDFVNHGTGTRRIACTAARDLKFAYQVKPAFITDRGLIWYHLRLGPAEFFVDLSEGMQLLDRLTGELDRIANGQYGVLPPRVSAST
jgi:hypothetical protein